MRQTSDRFAFKCFATDLDGTLLPLEADSPPSGLFQDIYSEVKQYNALLVYASGRDLGLITSAINSHGLPIPEYIVADVGTSVYERVHDTFVLFEKYQHYLSTFWPSSTRETIVEKLSSVSDMRLQESEKQTPLKISYYCESLSLSQIVGNMQRLLEPFSEQITIIRSIDPYADLGLIDVLPAPADKYTAISAILQERGIEAHEVIYAGDSGNDRQAFFSPMQSIIVANTAESLKQELRTALSTGALSKNVYFASENATAGVLEGLRFFTKNLERRQTP